MTELVTANQETARGAVPTPRSVRTVHALADLTAIFESIVNVVVLRRAVPGELAPEVRQAIDQRSFTRLAVVAPGVSQQQLAALLPDLPWLASDVHLWVEVLADLTGSERVGVRLATVETAMCPRLHVDHVTLRAVCTYGGPGTEYVANEDVDRRWLGHASRGMPDEDSGLLLRSRSVLAASPGDLVLLKGEAWPDNAERGAVHRSPIASAAAPRLLLTLDPLSA